jgi:hypothetical protein
MEKILYAVLIVCVVVLFMFIGMFIGVSISGSDSFKSAKLQTNHANQLRNNKQHLQMQSRYVGASAIDTSAVDTSAINSSATIIASTNTGATMGFNAINDMTAVKSMHEIDGVATPTTYAISTALAPSTSTYTTSP